MAVVDLRESDRNQVNELMVPLCDIGPAVVWNKRTLQTSH